MGVEGQRNLPEEVSLKLNDEIFGGKSSRQKEKHLWEKGKEFVISEDQKVLIVSVRKSRGEMVKNNLK